MTVSLRSLNDPRPSAGDRDNAHRADEEALQ